MTILIVDASVIISWCSELKDLLIFDNLMELGYTVVVPERVIEEVHWHTGLHETVLDGVTRMACDQTVFEDLSARHFRLGKGELSVMAMGITYEHRDRDYICVLDDGLARDACEQRGLEFTGNIGLCILLVQEDAVTFDQALTTLRQMREGGARLPSSLESLLRGELQERDSR